MKSRDGKKTKKSQSGWEGKYKKKMERIHTVQTSLRRNSLHVQCGIDSERRAVTGCSPRAQVKHVPLKLHKRLSRLSAKLSPSVCRPPAADCLNPPQPPPPPLLPLPPSRFLAASLIHPHPPPCSLLLSSTSSYSCAPTQLSRAEPRGPSAGLDSNGFNKNTVWGMRIEFHTWTPRRYMCFFLIKKEEAAAAPRAR